MLGSLLAAAGLAAVALGPAGLAARPAPPKSITLVDRTWVCSSRVNLDSVTVAMGARVIAEGRRNEDAIHLESGCTGRIGRVDVTQSAADGIKVAEGAHDLTIGGGRIRCLAKAPVLHQDGVQVMGGTRITFQNLEIDCGRADDRLINSDLFINQSGRSARPPTDVVCEGCTFGGWAAHTVSVQHSVRSGVTDSSLCLARFPELTLAIGPQALQPVGTDNRVHQCGPGQLTMESSTRALAFGKPVLFDGLFLAQTLGSPVHLERRPYDSTTFSPVTTVHTDSTSRWQVLTHPGVEATYRARLGDVVGPEVDVQVQPLVVLKPAHRQLVARVLAGRSFAGRTVTLQRKDGRAWVDVRTLVLGRRSSRLFTYGHRRPVTLRLSLAATPGYLPATSAPRSFA
jgi:hypothetical protein